MAQRVIEFDAHSLLQLLTHYLMDHQDRVPLDAELLSAGVSPILSRYLMLEAKSEHEWKDIPTDPNTRELVPLHVRYEGRKTMSWGQDKDALTEWRPSVGTPKQ